MSTIWQVIGILGLLSGHAAAESTRLVWEWTGTPIQFLLTMTPETGSPQTQTVPPQRCLEKTDDGWDTYCAPLSCTMQGLFDITVRAERSQGASPTSVPVRVGCLGHAGQCTCTGELSGPVAEETPPIPPPEELPSAESVPPLPTPPQRSQPLVTAIRPYQGQLIVLFRHPRTAPSLPTRFLLSYTSPSLASRLLYAVPLHDVTACQQQVGTDSQTWCTRMGCPGSGAWTFDVRAEYPDAWGPVSPGFACTIIENAPDCTCQAGRNIPGAERVPEPTHLPTRVPEKPAPAPLTDTPPAPPARPPPPPPPGGPTNLVQAPSTTRPWHSASFAGTQTQTAMDPATQREGRVTTQLTGRGEYYAQTTSPTFPVESGQTYDVAAWVKLQGITKLVEVNVFYWGKDGTQLRAWGEAIGGRLKDTRAWTRLGGPVTTPPDAAQAAIQVRVMSRGGSAWVDAVSMSRQQEEDHATQ